MKLLLALSSLFILILFSELDLKAQPLTRTHRNQISGKKVIDKSNGKEIKEENFGVLFANYPNAVLEPIIDMYGEIESYEFDSSKSSHIQTRDVTKRTPKGEPFLPFVMKTVDGKSVESKKLIGQPVLLIFQVSLKEPFFVERIFKEAASIACDYASTKPLETIMLTEDSKDEISAFNAQCFKIVPDGHNFNQRYLVTEIPSVVLIDKEGKLVSYYSSCDFNKLKDDLNLLQ